MKYESTNIDEMRKALTANIKDAGVDVSLIHNTNIVCGAPGWINVALETDINEVIEQLTSIFREGFILKLPVPNEKGEEEI